MLKKYKKNILLFLLLLLLLSCGNLSLRLSFNESDAPGKIENFVVNEVTSSSAIVSWGGLFDESGLGINMTYHVLAFSNNTEIARNSVESTQVDLFYTNRVSGLSSGVPYRIIVQAINSGGNVQAEASGWAVPGTQDFSGAGDVSKMLSKVVGVTNTADGEMEVTWEVDSDSAHVYAVIATEDLSDLSLPLVEIKKDKKTVVVCSVNIAGCPAVNKAGNDRMRVKISELSQNIFYNVVVLPLTFRDLAGIKFTDSDGEEVSFADAVKELIKESGSPVGKQLRTVAEELAADNTAVKSKSTGFWSSDNEVGSPSNLVLKSYNNRIHALWDHDNTSTRYEVTLLTADGTINKKIDVIRRSASQLLGGAAVFTEVAAGDYTVMVKSYSGDKEGGLVEKDVAVADEGSEFIAPVAITDLEATQYNPGEMILSWETEENDSISGYHIYFYQNSVIPSLPNFTADKGEVEVTIKNLSPGSYTVRVDSVADGVIVQGGNLTKSVYGSPDAPKLLNLEPIGITNIGNKLYHSSYGFTVVEGSSGEPNDLKRLKITYGYRIDGGAWIGNSDISTSKKVVFKVEDDLNPMASYGKSYEVAATVRNSMGFEKSTIQTYTFKSFPEPIRGDEISISSASQKLLVAWPKPETTHQSSVARYRVVLTDGANASPRAEVYADLVVSERFVLIDNLVNGKLYTVNVFPESVEGWSLLSALKSEYSYPESTANDEMVGQILSNYIGAPAQGSPEDKPNPLKRFSVDITYEDLEDGTVDVSWSLNPDGSQAKEYVLEYLKSEVDKVVGNNSEVLKNLDWSQAKSLSVSIKDIDVSGNYKVTGLNTESGTYVFRGKAMNSQGASDYVYYVLKFDATESPSQVRDIIFSAYSNNSFTVSWSHPIYEGVDRYGEIVGISGYRVSWRKKGETNYISSEKLSAKTLSYVITDLEQGVEYEVLVQANNNANGPDNYNDGETVNTITPTLPSAVSGINYSDWHNNGFTVSWTAADPGRSGETGEEEEVSYVVTLYNAANQSKVLEFEDVTTTSKVITGIAGGEGYYVEIKAKNSYGIGISAQGEETWTSSVPERLSVINVVRYLTDGFTLSWDAPSDPGKMNDGSGSDAAIIGYEVRISRDEGAIIVAETISEGSEGSGGLQSAYALSLSGSEGSDVNAETVVETSKHFSGLDSGTPYHVQVVALNDNGKGETHPVTRIWTGSLASDVGVVSTTPGFNNINVAWHAVEHGMAGNIDEGSGDGETCITSYLVEIKEDTAGAQYSQFGREVTSTNLNITGLLPGKSYRVRVTATNMHGSSEAKESEMVTTLPTPVVPGSPESVSLMAHGTSGNVAIRWEDPSDPGIDSDGNRAAIIGYKLQYSMSLNGTKIDLSSTPISEEAIRLTGDIGKKAFSGKSYNYVWLSHVPQSTTYYFWVSAINDQGEGPSKMYKFTSMTFDLPPSAPHVFDFQETDTAAVLSWHSPNLGLYIENWINWKEGVLVRYKLEYENPQGNWEEVSETAVGNTIRLATKLTTQTNVTLLGLTPGASYKFRVFTITEHDTSSGSSVKVKYLPKLPGAPVNSKWVSAGKHYLAYAWEPSHPGYNPDGSEAAITHYKLQYSMTLDGPKIDLSETASAGSTIKLLKPLETAYYDGRMHYRAGITGLTSAVTYYFWVSAVNKNGVGPAVSVKMTTLSQDFPVDPPYRGVSLAGKTSSSVDLAWEHGSVGRFPDGSIPTLIRYKLEYQGPSGVWKEINHSTDESTVRLESPVTTGTSATALGLTSGVTYKFRIYTISTRGTSSPSPQLTVKVE